MITIGAGSETLTDELVASGSVHINLAEAEVARNMIKTRGKATANQHKPNSYCQGTDYQGIDNVGKSATNPFRYREKEEGQHRHDESNEQAKKENLSRAGPICYEHFWIAPVYVEEWSSQGSGAEAADHQDPSPQSA
jgi:hypothetical protein